MLNPPPTCIENTDALSFKPVDDRYTPCRNALRHVRFSCVARLISQRTSVAKNSFVVTDQAPLTPRAPRFWAKLLCLLSRTLSDGSPQASEIATLCSRLVRLRLTQTLPASRLRFPTGRSARSYEKYRCEHRCALLAQGWSPRTFVAMGGSAPSAYFGPQSAAGSRRRSRSRHK